MSCDFDWFKRWTEKEFENFRVLEGELVENYGSLAGVLTPSIVILLQVGIWIWVLIQHCLNCCWKSTILFPLWVFGIGENPNLVGDLDY